MAKPLLRAAGGLHALAYSLRKGREAGGILALYRRLGSRNACKTCALGMGGQRGGMVDEAGGFPEVCKKSVQSQAGDMQAPIGEDFFRSYSVAELERWSSMQLEQAGRLAFPVTCGEGDSHFRRIGWDEALDRVAAELTGSPPEQTFFYASGRSSNEAAFLLQAVARAYGSNNIHSCSNYCHRASAVALEKMTGAAAATVDLEDLDRTDLVLLAGANPASNHPRLIRKLVDLRRRGGTVIVVNPLRELGLVRHRVPGDLRSMLFGSTVCDLYVQPRIGSDIALFKALVKAVLQRDGVDRVFLRNHVDGWDAVEADVRGAEWDALIADCGVSPSEIDRAGDAICRAKKGICVWAMGMTHHEHGVDNILALSNLAVARGWIGGSGRGLLPLRGHSNEQGIGSVGFTPELKVAFARKMEEFYGVPSRASAGMDTIGSMVAAERGGVRVAVLLGGNLYGSNPDSKWAAGAMRKIRTTVSITTKLNQGHLHGRGRRNLLLPVFTRDEEVEATTQESMFGYVRLSEGGQGPPPGELKSEVEVVNALASRVLQGGPFRFEKMDSHAAIRDAISNVVPGFAAIGEIDRTRREFRVAGRTFHEPRFETPSGNVRVHVTPVPRIPLEEDQFRMMTVRSEGQFNTVVHEEEDLYRGNLRRDVIMMNVDDGARLRLGENDPVTVESEAGRLDAVVAFVDLPAGDVAMYYPEANVLVPRRIDGESKTPAFKSVAVRIVK